MADGGVISGPLLYSMMGAGAGAMLDKKNPLRGAALGGLGGYFAPGLIASSVPTQAAAPILNAGAATAAGSAAGEGVALEALYGGVNPAVAAQMSGGAVTSAQAAATRAAMLGMGPTGGGMTGGLIGAPQAAAAGKGLSALRMAQMGMQVAGGGGQQRAPMGGGAAPMPQMPQQPGGSFAQASPYAQADIPRQMDPMQQFLMRRQMGLIG